MGRITKNVLQLFWWRIVIRLFLLVYQFYFCMLHPITSDFLTSLFLSQKLFHRILKLILFLVRQLNSLKKMEAPSRKFTVLVSWFPICMPSILISASIKIASASAMVMHNNIESGQPWWNLWKMVKESDRKSFILFIDGILVEATRIMWMNSFL